MYNPSPVLPEFSAERVLQERGILGETQSHLALDAYGFAVDKRFVEEALA